MSIHLNNELLNAASKSDSNNVAFNITNPLFPLIASINVSEKLIRINCNHELIYKPFDLEIAISDDRMNGFYSVILNGESMKPLRFDIANIYSMLSDLKYISGLIERENDIFIANDRCHELSQEIKNMRRLIEDIHCSRRDLNEAMTLELDASVHEMNVAHMKKLDENARKQ